MKKNSIFVIIRKELARFFGDKRMVITTILLPGLLIYVMYSFMGGALTNQFTVEQDTALTVAVTNLPESVKTIADGSALQFMEMEAEAQAKNAVISQKVDLYAIFPETFDADVAAYETSSGLPAPNVELYYNSASTSSGQAYSVMEDLLQQYESALANKFDINRNVQDYDLATDEDVAGSIFAAMMPMLLMIFLFSGCMAVAPEAIAGEKERGTIATLLITPVKRSQLALGKIVALALIALLAGISSTTGTVLSLPKLMGGMAEGLDSQVYGLADYGLLALVILSTVLLLITLISIISAFAKTVKEAQTIVTPMMILVVLVGITAMLGHGAEIEVYYYLIPLYNSVQCMVGIFSFAAIPSCVVLTVVSNLLCTGIGVFVLTRMFHSEKIIFSR